jgi:beta-lactamase class A
MAANTTARRRSKPNSRRNTKSSRQQPRHRKSVDRSSVRSVSPTRPTSPLIHLVRLAIWALGASTIVGTAISVVHPPKQPLSQKVEPVVKPKSLPIDSLKLQQENPALKSQLQALSTKNSKLDASHLFVALDSGEYSNLGADRVLPAASTIKLPILIALFQDIDAKKVQLTEKITIDKDSIVGEAGDLQAEKPGTQVSVEVVLTKMITVSDNTATNLLIRRLGGQAALNQRFRSWGLKTTTINHQLPDLEGTNVTTARELAGLMAAIERGKIVADPSRTEILRIMSNTKRNTMLPQGLGTGAKIAHKTGDIGTLVADVGAIELPSGKIYIAAVLVKRPRNDPAGPALVRQMSKVAYQHFNQKVASTFSPAPGFSNSKFGN